MSFDLYLWATPSPVSADRADDICRRLAAGEPGASADPRLLLFASDLEARYPRLEDLVAADADDSPWSMSPAATAERVILMIRSARADALSAEVRELAGESGLVCYDPQAGQVHHPPQATPDGAFRLEASDGSRLFGPGAGEIDHQVRRLSEANWYAWLEREEGRYVQAGLGARAGAPDGRYALEYQDGSPAQHYRAVVESPDEVATAFIGFASGKTAWKSARSWTRV